ncbi:MULTISPECIES: Bug family tripartite tricarboxylate transporter substrate binding protein [Polaromonas]|uniref:Bug family tripartite tricarboxylate transporter substrate binding protein n=1 Tax=Polaromonas aquatica TaxID=332657 RepID=A0ABW1TVN0_9BURK
MQHKLQTFIRGLLALSLVSLAGIASAQAFPSRPITLVVPFAPGGPTDTISRNIAQKMSDSLGQPVLVDNRPGGGGQIAGSMVKQAKPDGYTLFVGATEMFAINQTLFSKFSYDPLKDFKPVSAFVQTPMILVVSRDNPANSVQELIALAKTKPGGLTYASQGLGSIGHMLGQTMALKTGTTLVHIPYKGSSPALQDLVTGRVDMMFDVVASSGPLITAGKLKALAVANAKPFASLPSVPTLSAGGVTGLDASVWFGVVAPAGTPDAVVATLNESIAKAVNTPDLTKRFADQGMHPLPMNAQQFAVFMKGEVDRWTPLVKASGAVVD